MIINSSSSYEGGMVEVPFSENSVPTIELMFPYNNHAFRTSVVGNSQSAFVLPDR